MRLFCCLFRRGTVLKRERILTDRDGVQSDFKSVIILINIGAEKSGELQLSGEKLFRTIREHFSLV